MVYYTKRKDLLLFFMEKDAIIESVCVKHCRYYRPSKDEALACRGFFLVQRLLQKGKKITFPEVMNGLSPHTEETLVGNLCVACPFFPDDCDFSLKKDGSFPCGGFLVLGSLIEAGGISIDDIRNIDYTLQ
jgi:hypothetical protein